MIYNIQNKDQLNIAFKYATRILFEKGKVSVIVDITRKKRTSKENRYYWGFLVAMAAHDSGYPPIETHILFKENVLGYKNIEFRGRTIKYLRSTTELSTVEFEDYAEIGRAHV